MANIATGRDMTKLKSATAKKIFYDVNENSIESVSSINFIVWTISPPCQLSL